MVNGADFCSGNNDLRSSLFRPKALRYKVRRVLEKSNINIWFFLHFKEQDDQKFLQRALLVHIKKIHKTFDFKIDFH